MQYALNENLSKYGDGGTRGQPSEERLRVEGSVQKRDKGGGSEREQEKGSKERSEEINKINGRDQCRPRSKNLNMDENGQADI